MLTVNDKIVLEILIENYNHKLNGPLEEGRGANGGPLLHPKLDISQSPKSAKEVKKNREVRMLGFSC